MAEYEFHIQCIDAKGKDIIAMNEASKRVSFKTFFRRVDLQITSDMLGYAYGREPGLHIKDDPCAHYFHSKYKGENCYYLVWSGIEYVFLKEKQ